MAKGKGIHSMMTFVVGATVVHETSDASSLAARSAFHSGAHASSLLTCPPYRSMTKARPSNAPIVYILGVSTCGRPSFMYHICRFPPPRSGPVARNWKSAIHSDCATLRHVSECALSGEDLA